LTLAVGFGASWTDPGNAWFSTIGPFSDSKPKPDVHAIVQSRIARDFAAVENTDMECTAEKPHRTADRGAPKSARRANRM
jgi:hypothetical protein